MFKFKWARNKEAGNINKIIKWKFTYRLSTDWYKFYARLEFMFFSLIIVIISRLRQELMSCRSHFSTKELKAYKPGNNRTKLRKISFSTHFAVLVNQINLTKMKLQLCFLVAIAFLVVVSLVVSIESNIYQFKLSKTVFISKKLNTSIIDSILSDWSTWEHQIQWTSRNKRSRSSGSSRSWWKWKGWREMR